MITKRNLLVAIMLLAGIHLGYSAGRAQQITLPAFITQWGGTGSGEGQFRYPEKIAIDYNGFVYVADKDNVRIQKFTLSGVFVTQWSTDDETYSGAKPCGIAIDSSGFVYVTSRGCPKVKKYTTDGTFVTEWYGDFFFGKSVAVDNLGFVYVLDRTFPAIYKYTTEGIFVKKWGEDILSEGYTGPVGIDVDSSGFVYVCDSVACRILKFTGDGNLVGQWGSPGNEGDGLLTEPQDITIDSRGLAYVADTAGWPRRIQIFTTDGIFIAKFGENGGLPGQFQYPMGIAIDSSGNIFVSDSTCTDYMVSDRVQRFTPIQISAPTLSSLSPNSSTPGGPGFILSVHGYNFMNGATVLWDGSARPTTYVSSTEINAEIRPEDVAVAKTVSISVHNPASTDSNTLQFAISAVPSITSLAPASATPGGAGFTLVVNGSFFVNGAVVMWDGSDRPTTFISSSEVRASVSAGDIAQAKTISVTARNPGSATSNVLQFAINNVLVPSLLSLTPSSATVGGAGLTLVVNGASFVNGAVVIWDGSDRTTTFISSSEVRAAITASDVAAIKTVSVAARNPGSATSNTLQFTVTGVVPILTSLSPSSATVGGAGFNLMVNGSQFSTGATVMWDGSDRPTSFISSTQLRATINGTDISSPKTVAVTARNVGSAASISLSFQVSYAAPVLTSVNPTSAVAGDPAFVLSVMGTGFVNGATAMWNGSDRTTSYVSSSELAVTIGATDILSARTVQITARNPGSSTSNSIGFTVANPIPTLTALVPSSMQAGSQGFTLAVTGSRFAAGAVVRWNGSDRTTSYVNSSEVDASITTNDILDSKTVQITVRNPNGGTSAPLTFSVTNPSTPTLASISPPRATGGGAAFTLTLNGSNFVSGSVVNWNGTSKTTTFVSNIELKAAILAEDIRVGGDFQVTVTNPAPAGSTSNALTFSVSSFALSSSPFSATVN